MQQRQKQNKLKTQKEKEIGCCFTILCPYYIMDSTNLDKFFGPYLSERQWGTVREDYSHNGDCWRFFSHDKARYNVYLHGEDGLLGWCDYQAKLCVSLALWNCKDKILKERLFGVTGPQGNHGEDVKEIYYYLDNVPDHNYMRALYRYPQTAFPYKKLVRKNRERKYTDPEFELIDTGAFDNDYWDVYMEFAKDDPKTCLCRYTFYNRGRSPATLHILPQIWLRDTWSHNSCGTCHTDTKPNIRICKDGNQVQIDYSEGSFFAKFDIGPNGNAPILIFTDNEAISSNTASSSATRHDHDTDYKKDAFHQFVIAGETKCVNPEQTGTKCAAAYCITVNPGNHKQIQMCLWPTKSNPKCANFGSHFDSILKNKATLAKKYYSKLLNNNWSEEEKNIAHQAYSGLLWSKQFYCYDVEKWFKSNCRRRKSSFGKQFNKNEPKRNKEWFVHLKNCDVISMPDKWEFPWYATWDLAFHMIPFCTIDPNFTKKQLLLFLSDNYLHPNGQLPAYEFDFSDANPPVHAWACLHVYRETAKKDIHFLKRCFQRLLLNYTWWINTKKLPGPGHLYGGGFLGMDNISVYNRSFGVPPGYRLAQADGTCWMAFYSLKLFEMAIELSQIDIDYLDLAERFLNYFFLVADNANSPICKTGFWDEDDLFFYDFLMSEHNTEDIIPLCIRSMVGLVPLFACSFMTIPKSLSNNPKFVNLLERTITKNKLLHQDTVMKVHEYTSKEKYHIIFSQDQLFISLISKVQLQQILNCVLKESEFLSRYGVRSLSKYHEVHPYSPPVEPETGHKISSGKTDAICCLLDHSAIDKVSQTTHDCLAEMHLGERPVLEDDDSDIESNDSRYDDCGRDNVLKYSPGESISRMFGGNSNWRGPIWFCMNYLLLESLQNYYGAYGNNFKVEMPTGSGVNMNLQQVVREISQRIVSIFLPDKNGRRPVHGCVPQYMSEENWRHLVLFYEFFNAENGRGCGASHQTGWTALIVEFMKKKYS